jgi:hypothetical protein
LLSDGDDRFEMLIMLGLYYQTAAFDEFRQPRFVVDTDVVLPVAPVMIALERQRAAVRCRIIGADNGAGVRGGAITGGRQFVDIERLPAFFGQLETDRSADDAGADDDGVVMFSRVMSSHIVFKKNITH